MPILKKYIFANLILITLILSALFLYKKYGLLAEFVELKYVSLTKKKYPIRTNRPIKLEELVAHAGGSINSLTYTNSLEALNLNYNNGFRFFEIDFEWTSDKQLVLLHDWGMCVSSLFGAKPGVYSLNEFKNFKMITGTTQMTFYELVDWLKKHPDALAVTDMKRDVIPALRFISREYPDIKGRIIPQIYRFREYDEVIKLGFDDLILTLYKENYQDENVIEFLKSHRVAAVTMPIDRAMTGLPVKLKRMGIFVYAHTVNDDELKNKLKSNGVDGFYTDFLNYHS